MDYVTVSAQTYTLMIDGQMPFDILNMRAYENASRHTRKKVD